VIVGSAYGFPGGQLDLGLPEMIDDLCWSCPLRYCHSDLSRLVWTGRNL